MIPKEHRKKAGVALSAGCLAICLAFLPKKEGERLTAYRDIAGVWTICDGETEGVYAGQTATHQECLDRLSQRLPEFNAGVESCVHVPLSDSRRAALISFFYNVGIGAGCRSSVVSRLNKGDVDGGCGALLLYDHAGGRAVSGLHRRRQEERAMCLKG